MSQVNDIQNRINQRCDCEKVKLHEILKSTKSKLSNFNDVQATLTGYSSNEVSNLQDTSMNQLLELNEKIQSASNNVILATNGVVEEINKEQEKIRQMIASSLDAIENQQNSTMSLRSSDQTNRIQSITGDVDSIVGSAIGVTKDAIMSVLKLNDTYNTSAQQVASSISNTTQNVSSQIVASSDKVANKMVYQAATTSNTLLNTTNNIINGIFGNNKTSSSSNVLNQVAGITQSLISSTAQNSNGIRNEAANTASNIINTSNEQASNITNTVSTVSGNLLESVKKVSSDFLGDKVGSSLLNDLLSGGDGSGVSTEGLGGAFGTAKDTAQTGDAKSALGGLMSSLSSGIGSTLSSPLVQGAVDVVGSFMGIPSPIISSVMEGVSSIGDMLLGNSESTADSQVNAAQTTGSTLLGATASLAESALSLLPGGSVISGLAGSVLSNLDLKNLTMDDVTNFANKVSDVIGGGIDSAISSVVSEAKELLSGASESVEELCDATLGEMGDLASEAIESFESIGSDIDSFIDDWFSDDFTNDALSELEYDDMFESDDDWDFDLDGDGEDDISKWIDPDADSGEDEGDSSSESSESDLSPEPEEEPGTGAGATNSFSPQAASDPSNDNNGLSTKEDKMANIGWDGAKFDFVAGMLAMTHDGDQQVLNPYGHRDAKWTTYSFRPCDTKGANLYPQIAITPASFEALDSMDTMLDNIPYVVIKEFFYKNMASDMMNFVKILSDKVQEAFSSPEENNQEGTPANEQSGQTGGGTTTKSQPADNTQDKSDTTVGALKETGNKIIDKIKEVFLAADLGVLAIDIPYVLYCALRKKVYGNTYVFPYIVDEGGSSIINQANNQSEWQKGGGGIAGMIKGVVDNVASAVGNLAATFAGSDAKTASLFPAPTWNGPGEDYPTFKFDLMLINDNIVKTRNNYMCVNTIINNNRYIQKAMLTFPGALYELWLPTGQRHLMCSANLQLSPLGLNRVAPTDFFKGRSDTPGANFKIGASTQMRIMPEKMEHKESEVIPDGYKLSLDFKSCLPNNLNTSVFQYYVEMTGYDDVLRTDKNSESKDDLAEKVKSMVTGQPAKETPTTDTGTKTEEPAKETKSSSSALIAREFSRSINEIVYDYEKFDESTYNKKIGKLKSQFGDQAMNADSVVVVIKNANKTIRESNSFLSKLYDAENNNLWYKPFPKDEYYTTLEPNYQQILKKRYQEQFKSIRKLDSQISTLNEKIVQLQLDILDTYDLEQREKLVEQKVSLNCELNSLKSKRSESVDNLLQISTDMIQVAYDEQDTTVSLMKNDITLNIFKQVWNEKIMNSYEREKVQYMTSKEKERYFKEKIIDLQKYDPNGILNHQDWFFRVVVLDYIIVEMQRLINWFKSCSFDDFETIYKIVRKLNLLQLDIDKIKSNDAFDINKTNLFSISDEDMKNFTKIDDMLIGNTLYQLFISQIRINKVTPIEANESDSKQEEQKIDPILVQEQRSELDMAKRRKVRSDLIVKYWGSEAALTKDAYDKVNTDYSTREVVIPTGVPESEAVFKGTLQELKDEIIKLKLENSQSEQSKLQILLGGFTQQVSFIKEELIIEKMTQIKNKSLETTSRQDDDINSIN